ncbi:MAG: hypothetical protein HP490_18270 [Nitrospira sp.]|nr:hypothetical protein [Nitrospira sp.]
MVEDTQARFRLTCRLLANSIAEPTPFGIELDATVYRMTQELVTNVIRHAKASSITIRLEANDDTVQLIVEDNGVGFAAAAAVAADRYGLRGIRERAELLGGTVAIRSQPGEGTIVTVGIPLRGREPKESSVGLFGSRTSGSSPREALP